MSSFSNFVLGRRRDIVTSLLTLARLCGKLIEMSELLKRWSSPLLLLALASACTDGGPPDKQPGQDKQDNPPEVDTAVPEQPEPPPVEPDASETTISVASVRMIQDCPDPEPAEPPASAERAAKPPAAGAKARRAPGQGGPSIRQPCDQSAVQLALETKSEAAVSVEIAAVRLLTHGQTVAELDARKPTIWTESRYQPWDQRVSPGAPINVSYKLSVPHWSEVDKATGESSYGLMFTLEIDLRVDGERVTVTSPEFAREKPHMIVT